MMLWLGFAALVLATLAFLLWPLLRPGAGASRRAHEIAAYRAQLDEVDEEQARGTLNDEQATAARLEIQRRLLRADAQAEAGPSRSGPGTRLATVASLVLVPVLAGGLYLAIGRPDAARLDDAVVRQQTEAARQQRDDTNRMIEQLRARLVAEPGRLDGWMLLGRSLLLTDRPGEAIEAFDRVIALAPHDEEGYALRAEALTNAADGTVTAAAQRDFRAVLERDPAHPGARYYLGLARLQEGDVRGAYDDWHGLAADTPADAPWLGIVQDRLRELAPRLNIPLARAIPSPRPAVATEPAPPPAASAAQGSSAQGSSAPGPDRAQVEAAQQMSAEDRQAMIRGMVDRLAARLEQNPDDPEGWLRLARARETLGEVEAARTALRRAIALQPDRVEPRLQLAFSLAGTSTTSTQPLPAEALAEFRAALALAPANGQALWFVGRGAYEAGDRAVAAIHWNKLLTLLPPGSPEAKELAERIAGLGR